MTTLKRYNTGVEKIEKGLFYFSLIDILFLPYVFFVATSYSQLFIFVWFIMKLANKKIVFRRNEYNLFLVFSLTIILSTILSFNFIPVEYFNFAYSENIKRAIQFITSISYYFFFYHIFSKYKFNLDKILILFVIYVLLWAFIFYYNVDFFVKIKNIFNPYDPFSRNFDEFSYGDSGGYMNILRFNFIWSDPNNISYAIIGTYIFIITYFNINYLKFFLLVFSLIFINFLTMSSGGWLSIALFAIYPTVLYLKNNFLKQKGASQIFLIIFISISIAGIIYIFSSFLQDSYFLKSLERLENNSSESRVRIWKLLFEEKVDHIFYYFILGTGFQIFVNNRPFHVHSGHFLLFFAYGFWNYLSYMLLFFRKYKFVSLSKYLFVLPFLMCFTINTMLGELKLCVLFYLLVAYSRSSLKEMS